jgi:hypothetical protein
MKVDDEYVKVGVLIIHKDLPGTHDDGPDCWCEPYVIAEDTLLTQEQIIEKVSKKPLLN